MRIIKFIFKSVLSTAILVSVGFLLAREILMFMGVSKVKSSLSTLRSASVQKSYFTKCKEKGSVFIDGDDPAVMQLRFVSDNEYVLEVLCSQFSIDPILLERVQLPMFIKKVAGQTGIIWGDTRSGIALEAFKKQRSIGVEDRVITSFSTDSELGVGPITSCAGYGFSCCRYESEQGSGEQFSGSLDCPKTCFSSCEDRPIILSFNTQPFLNLKDRSVTINNGESITFSFVIDYGLTDSVAVEVNYGDGQVDSFYKDSQTFTHDYQCSKKECSYSVKLSAKNSQGISAVDLPIMNMLVLVKGQ